jgi:hypothetical protein
MSTEVKIDSRICVKQTDSGFNIDRQDVSVADAIEIMERITFFLRARDFVMPMIAKEVIDSIEIYPDEPIDQPKVCIAFDFETYKIQVAVIGMQRWDACVLLNIAQAYLVNLQLGLITE